ncbi:MAG: hypothetical protein K1060chlam2_01045 [Chlamydiae bacterium]|nr:hypothetical protein [Chlamydiota bacterium]
MSGVPTPHSYPQPESESQHISIDLFLSGKIKGEIEEAGCVSAWSKAIEVDLVAKILPEFKEKFPKSSLGTSVLKKVWEKVAYYYEKFQGDKGTALLDGKLNLKFMIRESLRSSNSPDHLPTYSSAEKLAGKLSDCIRAMDGNAPEVGRLTKMIWAIQKHLLKDLNSVHAKIPHDEYTNSDKLIVKTLLEITSKGENLESYALKQEIARELKIYEGTRELTSRSQLTSTLSMVLAEKLYHTSIISCHFSLKEKRTIESFICFQLELSKHNQTLTSDDHRVELVQRILALFAIAEELPKELSEESLRHSIQESTADLSSDTDRALFIFINAEMHLMSESKSFDDQTALEEILVECYRLAKDLPILNPIQMEQFELFIWKIIEEEGELLDHIEPEIVMLIEKEVGNVLIDNPRQSFRMVVSAALQFFKRVHVSDITPEVLNEKIELWAMQNDMLTRWIHFDQNTPLLGLIKKLWKSANVDESNVNHGEFIARALTLSLKEYPLLESFEEALLKRLWILYKYFWYTTLSSGRESTYERFLMWHRAVIQLRHSDSSRERVEEILKKLSNQLIPLAPFEDLS